MFKIFYFRLKAVAETTKFFRFDDVWVTGYLAKELKIKHLDMTQFLTIKKKTGLLFKSVQNPEIYHKDFLAILTGRNFEMFYTLHQHSRWCYFNKCFSNIYHPQVNLSTIDVIPERVMLKELS
ncbi:uncharacterized protein LOC111717089 [Eurytemora carolleeae]|uniref:uncharacterized protein LOC111717089 n=1 Tax=Eurytemora carolleeae TaxID=1294199 RepID=UPI000C768119|nr:uncharacterized protein LOC111717089 [Eurytemora carolleeae]|eukprot:XP_023348373.1 uncharacterized protein LOC111717089 [Eurytemora affinis]